MAKAKKPEVESPFPVVEHEYLEPPAEDPILQVLQDQLNDNENRAEQSRVEGVQHMNERSERLDEHEVPNEKRPY